MPLVIMYSFNFSVSVFQWLVSYPFAVTCTLAFIFLAVIPSSSFYRKLSSIIITVLVLLGSTESKPDSWLYKTRLFWHNL